MPRSFALSYLLVSALSSAAAAAPSFKTAPVPEKSDDGGGWSAHVPFDTEAAPPWAQWALDFLAGNYGYVGVAAVLLMLFLFARGPDRESAPQAGGAEDDDFFEPEDSRHYRGGPR